MDFDAIAQSRLIPDQTAETDVESLGKRIGEGGQKDSRVFISLGQIDCAVEGNDGFASSG